MSDQLADQVDGVAALAEPVRRSLYLFVVAQPEAVGREEAAAGVGVALHAAKFHLDRLVAEGLLETEYRRPPGRSGPGAGRPSKLYRRSGRELRVSLPERRYDLAADVLATAIEEASATGRPVASTVTEVADRRGHAQGAALWEQLGARASRARRVGALCDWMAEVGYEPRRGQHVVELANCPFHALAREHTDLVCGLNLALLGGVVDAMDDAGLAARLDPHEGRCCVVVTTG